jgi:cytochrome c553
MVLRIVLIVLGIAVVSAVAVLAWNYDAPTIVTQPIAFNHQLHLTKANLDCTTVCHSSAENDVFAGLPSKDVCYECHDPDEEYPEKPELARLAEYVDLDEDIAWQRVAVTPPDVFFSHRRHVTSGQVACARCHVGVAEAAEPLSEVTNVLTMDECLACHESEGADVDCLACHR